jgi:GNAT superfamily N-acetyltransferase
MTAWSVEYGTFWAVDTSNASENRLPPRQTARATPADRVTFGEIGSSPGDVTALAAAADLPSPQLFQQRLAAHRRCFVAMVDGQITAYGWVTQGAEYVGELERTFNFRDNEAYIWDCVTLAAWRGQHIYSALLSHIVYQLHDEGVQCVWIGASRQNDPSIRGIINAGFVSVVDVVYRRFLSVTTMWMIDAPAAPPPLLAAAYRILRAGHERCIGRLFIGYKAGIAGNADRNEDGEESGE